MVRPDTVDRRRPQAGRASRSSGIARALAPSTPRPHLAMTHVAADQRDAEAPAYDSEPMRTPVLSLTRADVLATSLVVVTYLVLAILANWNAWSMGATRALQTSQDPKLNTWLLAWTPFAVSHGVNPLFSHWVNVPYGVNYSANVAIPLLGIIVSPITAVWGPVAATNFVITLAFFSAAIGGYCFVRHWVAWRPAAFLGGPVLRLFALHRRGGGRPHPHDVRVPRPVHLPGARRDVHPSALFAAGARTRPRPPSHCAVPDRERGARHHGRDGGHRGHPDRPLQSARRAQRT